MKKIAILQSNYIPWKGYFDLINSVDEFVLYDDMQYTRRDWRNRNRIVTPQGSQWLSIPVDVKGKYNQKINETHVSSSDWSKHHWKVLLQNYSKARYFTEYSDIFESFYLNLEETSLSLINVQLIELINSILGISTKITWSSDYELVDGQTERLVQICRQAGADTYVSGPAAKQYFDVTIAERNNIHVEWADYSNYPVYRQLSKSFDHYVTILDLIFNEGAECKIFMKSFPQ